MIRSNIFHTLNTCTLKRCTSYCLSVCSFHRRLFCSRNTNDDGEGSSTNLPAEGRYVPQRIKKRLKNKGLDIDDLEYRTGGHTTSDIELEQAIQNSIVDKNIEIDFPSDIEKRKYLRNQEKHAYRPTDIDPEQTSILLFPGQGSQFVGMGKKLLAYPGVENLYNKASEILGYDLLSVCIGGPSELLNKTIYCQPAVVVTSLAAVERLKEEYPKAMERCVAVAGFSVGELTALIASEMISFEDGNYLF
ncbi:probable malonyl-CoA-acyl carrier protein transacylase, mitochondrial [Mercenaria mercenaria]|uniref:probable malonyl-CoA-acyl carrier protein transacylase, mitochondrial n=1 Tax=Mercenaria mercenaria TaxID=6596 RepID=UPI00234E7049|nr:probable malonyl-CoA-acyl carrier protein transacylase, mitochondrial [Mercenaria mercenaria]